MYLLINTSAADDAHIGQIISRHFTIETARAAQSKHARAVKRHNGSSAYVRTCIVQHYGPCSARAGDWLRLDATDHH